MQKRIVLYVGVLLGLFFFVFGLNFFLKFLPIPPSGSEIAGQFMGALYVSGFLAIIKVLEIVGGVLVAIPKTRKIGLLVLTPIVVNIIFYNHLLAKESILQPPILVMTILTAILIINEGKGLISFLKS